MTPEMSAYAMVGLAQQELAKRAPYQISHLVLRGYRDADIVLPVQELAQLNQVVRVVDETEPDYPFDQLKQRYDGTLLAQYIETLEAYPDAASGRKALYYGVQAMLNAMGEDRRHRMIIREANIGKFGKLENQKYQFAPQINVIYGANESGKSTLMQFLKAMLFGLEKTRVRKTLDTYNRYEPWDTPAYFYGSMMFETGQQQFLLERNFYYKEKRARLVNIRDGEELSVEYGDLDMLLGNVSAAAYENTCCIGQEQLLPGRELGVLLEDERSNLAQTGSGDFQLSKALQELEQKRKNAEKTRKELEQQRLSHIHQLEVNQQVLERDIAGLKAQQEKQSTQQGTVQEQVRALQQQMEPVQTAYQTVAGGNRS